MLAALAIGYIFKVAGSQNIVDKVLLVTTMISMLILSIMGLILSIQRFEIGLVSDNIRAYSKSLQVIKMGVLRQGLKRTILLDSHICMGS
jgi:hypothetical protein